MEQYKEFVSAEKVWVYFFWTGDLILTANDLTPRLAANKFHACARSNQGVIADNTRFRRFMQAHHAKNSSNMVNRQDQQLRRSTKHCKLCKHSEAK